MADFFWRFCPVLILLLAALAIVLLFVLRKKMKKKVRIPLAVALLVLALFLLAFRTSAAFVPGSEFKSKDEVAKSVANTYLSWHRLARADQIGDYELINAKFTKTGVTGVLQISCSVRPANDASAKIWSTTSGFEQGDGWIAYTLTHHGYFHLLDFYFITGDYT